MPKYTDVAALKAELPAGEPDGYTSEQWIAKLTAIIEQKSQEIDDSVGENYAFAYEDGTQKFPEIDSTPQTPATIEKICRYLACSDALGYFSGIYSSGENDMRLRRRDWAEKKIEKVFEGTIKISVLGEILWGADIITINNYYPDENSTFHNSIFTKEKLDERL